MLGGGAAAARLCWRLTFVTSAPKSASKAAHEGAAMTVASSTTLMPCRIGLEVAAAHPTLGSWWAAFGSPASCLWIALTRLIPVGVVVAVATLKLAVCRDHRRRPFADAPTLQRAHGVHRDSRDFQIGRLYSCTAVLYFSHVLRHQNFPTEIFTRTSCSRDAPIGLSIL
jgi:hypothetical protein